MTYLGSSARLSDCGRYRYELTRTWSRGLARRLVVIGLNPSTADATQDDPTIRRCVRFAQREGCGGLVMVNLFAFRATDPAELAAAADPIGPDNDTALQAAFWSISSGNGTVLAAWGAHPFAVERARDLFGWVELPPFYCLGRSKGGFPRHPLYVRSSQPFELYQVPGC